MVSRLALILLPGVALAQSADQPLTALPYTPGLDTSFMDRSVDPCVDFYRYSCGNWIKNNPIPPDQPSWDVYAKLTEENQKLLWGVLQQAADSRHNRTPNEQKICDFFHACMDESAVEKAGIEPLRPALDAIARLQSKSEIAPLLAREHVEQNSNALFNFGSSQDYADAQQVIAFANAGGLGLPDRDYYTKTDAKSVEIRARYVQHVARMLGLLGDPAATARTEAQTIMSIETAMAKAALTATDKRDPY